MINPVSGGSILPREVIQWLDSLDLAYSVRNPKMDLANGFVIAEILTRNYPNQLSILTFYNAQKKDRKIDNWLQIQKCKCFVDPVKICKSFAGFCFDVGYILVLARKKFKLTQEEYESIANLGPETAQSLLFRLYEFLTGEKVNVQRRLASTLPVPDEPLYKKPTASYIVKDRELERVVDNREKQARAKAAISQQSKMIQTQKYNTGLIEWLIQRRKEQIQQQVQKQKEIIEQKTKSFAKLNTKVEVRQIELKCFNSSTSKKQKGEFGDVLDSKGVIEFLTEGCAVLLKKQMVNNDLKKLGIDLKDKDISNLSLGNNGIPNPLQQLFHRSSELDPRGNLKVSTDTLNLILQLFKKNSEVNLIVDNIHNNFIDFKKFFKLFLMPLRVHNKQSQTFKMIVTLINQVARGMLRLDPQNTQLMFGQYLLGELLKIGQNAFKRAVISQLCLQFVRKQSQCYYALVNRVKYIYFGDIRTYVAFLAQFLERISHDCEDLQYNLWSQFFYYGFQALTSPSTSLRVNGAKIIANLFTDVVVASNDIISEKLGSLCSLVEDPWWEVRAQALIIFKAILLSSYKNMSVSSEQRNMSGNGSQTGHGDLNMDLNTKTILHSILQIFKINVSHNILRIGLIELAQLLNYEPSLCQRYLDILLHVGLQIRTDVLNTAVIKFGPVVYGANTFNYKLSGVPLVWNSLGVARALMTFFQRSAINRFQQAHLQILYATINRNGNFVADFAAWLEIFEQVKSRLFMTLLDDHLCELGVNIIKEFLEIPEIHNDIIVKSRPALSYVLNNVYLQIGDSQVKANLLLLFDYLHKQQSEFTYKIIKDFAEREKTKFLSSNLVDFMNTLARQRRKKMQYE